MLGLSLPLKKPINLLIIEAVVVAVAFGLGILLIDYLFKPLENYGRTKGLLILGGVTGALLHLLFEITGVNEWYSVKYCRMI